MCIPIPSGCRQTTFSIDWVVLDWVESTVSRLLFVQPPENPTLRAIVD